MVVSATLPTTDTHSERLLIVSRCFGGCLDHRLCFCSLKLIYRHALEETLLSFLHVGEVKHPVSSAL